MTVSATRSPNEFALRASEARFRSLVENQSELVSLSTLDGTLVWVNPAYARHFGRRPETMAGTDLLAYVADEDRAGVAALLAGVWRSGEPQTTENRMVDAGGQARWVAWTNRLHTETSGERLLHSVGRDVTARRLAKEALRESQAFLARTEHVAGVGGWRLDIDTGAVRWSAQTRRIHEVGDDFVPTLESAVRFYPPEARLQIDAAITRAIADGTPWDLELPFITGTGRRIWVRAQGEAEFEGGRAVRLSGAFQDITERSRAERALRELTAIVEATGDYVVQADRSGRLTYINPAARRALGMSADEAVGERDVATFNPPATNRLFAETILPAVAAAGVWLGKTVVYGAGWHEIPVSHMVIGHRDASGRIDHYSAVMRDIRGEVDAERALQRQTVALSSMMEAMPAVVAVADAQERYRFVNDAYERWFGKTREQCIGRTIAEVLGPADYARTAPYLRRVLAGETVEFEKEYAGPAGTRHLKLHYVPLWLDGRCDGFFATAHDVTASRREATRLLDLTQRDALTGLLNRAGLETFLDAQVEAGAGSTLAALYLDLDRFKPVNDAHGHAAGDVVLRAVAERLRGIVRPSDAVARLGGDEFALVLCGVREGLNARLVAEKAIAAIAAPICLRDGVRVEVGASVGVAFGADSGWRELVARADARLYQAKNAGRGRTSGVSGFLPL